MALLDFRVTRRFGDFVAVDDVSFSVDAGEFFTLSARTPDRSAGRRVFVADGGKRKRDPCQTQRRVSRLPDSEFDLQD